jgi:hypothetical protein
MESRNLKSWFGEGRDLTEIGRLEWFFVVDHMGHTHKDPWIHCRVCEGFPVGKTKESIRLKEGIFRTILSGFWPEGRESASHLVSELQNKSLVSVEEKREPFSSMPSRRRDRPMPDPAVERGMHELCARLDAMETTQRCTVDTGDISKDDSENEAGNEGEEVAVKDAIDEHLFRAIARIGAREKMDIPMYEGNLDVEELLD